MSTIVRKKISELKPHPRNEEIYGENENVDELVASIKKSGVVTILTITKDNVIMAGHRRWRACKQLVDEGDNRFDVVNCEVREFENEWKELEFLIIDNKTREKTVEQKAREAQILLEAEKRLSEIAKLNALKNVNRSADFGGTKNLNVEYKKGDSRDKVAEKLKIKSGHEVDRLVKSVKTIDRLIQENRVSDAELIRNELNNKSPSSAADLSSHIDELTEDEKQAIRDKKMSAYKVVSKYATKRVPKVTDDMPDEKQAELAHKQACKEAVEEYIAQSMGLIDIPEVPVDDRTDDLIAFFNSSVNTFTAAITNLIGNVPNFSEEQFNRVFGIIKIAENKLSNLKNVMEV